MNWKRGLGVLLLVVGVVFLLNSFSGITGFAVFSGVSGKVSGILGLIFVIAGILVMMGAEKRRYRKESDLVRRILSRKDLPKLSPRQRAFRRKLINLYQNIYAPLDQRKSIAPKKIAYFIPRYDSVIKTGEHDNKTGEEVFLGRAGSKKEYFSIDLSSKHRLQKNNRIYVPLGSNSSIPLPTHIDIKDRIGVNHYDKIGRAEIEWDVLLRHSDDIMDYFKKKAKDK